MTSLAEKAFVDRLPTEIESENAAQLKDILASQFKENEPTTLPFATNNGKVQHITLMPALAASLLELLMLVSSGRGFRMLPVESMLTTQQAADLLNVPRPYLIGLLENKDIPFTQKGRHRYIQANDLFSYKKKCYARSSKALENLARLDAGRIDAKEERI